MAAVVATSTNITVGAPSARKLSKTDPIKENVHISLDRMKEMAKNSLEEAMVHASPLEETLDIHPYAGDATDKHNLTGDRSMAEHKDFHKDHEPAKEHIEKGSISLDGITTP